MQRSYMDIKKYVRIKKIIVLCAGVFGALFFGFHSAHAATLHINSSSGTLSPGNIATLSVVLNAEGVSVNNAEAKIVFPTDLLEVISVSKSGSILSLWIEEPTYSNPAGIITFNGGIPTYGFAGSNGTVATFVVKAKKAGKADIIFADAAVRANDGFGTDVLTGKFGRTLSIIQSEEPVIKESVKTEPAPVIAALRITSPTHPSQESWYKEKSPTFQWQIPAGVTGVQTAIDKKSAGLPRVIYTPAISEKTVENVEDGVWHFKVRPRKDGEWGSVSTYVVRVDTVAPKKNSVTFAYDEERKVLKIAADIVDETSGVEQYDMYVNDSLIKSIEPAEFVKGTYELALSAPGKKTVDLVAVDRAGNSLKVSGEFTVPAVPVPVETTRVQEEQMLVSIGSLTIPALHLLIVALLVLILLVATFKLGSHYGRLYGKLKMRNALLKGDTTKVLLVLKRRLEKHLEILQRTRHSRILSKEEKEIKEAIEGDLDEVDRAIEEQKKDA